MESVSKPLCGEYSVPEKYHSISGWELVEHDYVMDNVSDLWGRNSDDVIGIIPWEASRFGVPIEDVALILVDRRTKDEPEWELHREITLATQSKRVDSHPNVSDYFSTPDLEWALEIAEEWLVENPTHTASSMFVPKNIKSDDIMERFSHFVNNAEDNDGNLMNENKTFGVVSNENDFPQDESIEDFIEPDTITFESDYTMVEYGENESVFNTDLFTTYKLLVGENIKKEPEITDTALISPSTENVIVPCPEIGGYYVVASIIKK